MTSVAATFDADGQLQRRLDQAIAALESPRDLFEIIGALLEGNIQARFDAKVDPTGASWKPLSPATLDIYESEWFIERNPAFAGGIPGSLLERTRRLRSGLAHNADDSGVEIGFAPYASSNGKWQIPWLHETGTKRMPRRGLLTADPSTGELGAGDQADIAAELERYLSELL